MTSNAMAEGVSDTRIELVSANKSSPKSGKFSKNERTITVNLLGVFYFWVCQHTSQSRGAIFKKSLQNIQEHCT